MHMHMPQHHEHTTTNNHHNSNPTRRAARDACVQVGERMLSVHDLSRLELAYNSCIDMMLRYFQRRNELIIQMFGAGTLKESFDRERSAILGARLRLLVERRESKRRVARVRACVRACVRARACVRVRAPSAVVHVLKARCDVLRCADATSRVARWQWWAHGRGCRPVKITTSRGPRTDSRQQRRSETRRSCEGSQLATMR
jgi:hypothetical protein